MKVGTDRAEAFLRAPGDTRLALLYGEDEGLVRHRAALLTRAVAGATDDPFRVVWLQREDHARLEEEATALSMLGGKRVVRVRDATDALAPRLAKLLTSATSLLVVEAGGLPSRSKLRGLAEAEPFAASIPCYPEDAPALGKLVRATLARDRIAADGDALEWLAANLGSDREATRAELEKLVLFCGPGGTLTLEDARACVGEQADLSVEDAALAAVSGQPQRADASLSLAFSEGASAVGVLRTTTSLLLRLHRARAAMQPGGSASAAVDAMRPPVFPRHRGAYAAALARFNAPQLARALDLLRTTELACKRTGAADEALARNALMTLAGAGRARLRSPSD